MLDKKAVNPMIGMESVLRNVDLNLLTVFDAVMQEQNVTRAAQNLGMSQPAVSNAVSRLKIMFNDELFVRHGRGIQPTSRARQLFGPIRQALQLIRNELPSMTFSADTSNRRFNMAICTPIDLRFAPNLLTNVRRDAPNVQMNIEAESDPRLAERVRYQDIDFVIDYATFDEPGFKNEKLFEDELVVVASLSHPRIANAITKDQLMDEDHAALSEKHGVQSFSVQAYQDLDCRVSYQGATLSNLLYVVSQSELITLAPRWIVDSYPYRDQLQVLALPISSKPVAGYLTWHESSERDKGHEWLKAQVIDVAKQLIN